MDYYKLVSGEEVLSVTDSPVWVRVSDRGKIIRCDLKNASGVLSADHSTIYHISGTKPLGSGGVYKDVLVSDITKDEYDTLYGLLIQCHTVTEAVLPEAPHVESVTVEEDGTYVEQLRSLVLRAMSAACKNAITDGIDVVLSDGSSAHFDMTVEDQLNISSALNSLNEGVNHVPFHASGELFRYFSADDIRLIAESANEHKTKHVVYHNSLKNWVLSMTKSSELSGVYYGIDIPREYCSEVFLQIQHK